MRRNGRRGRVGIFAGVVLAIGLESVAARADCASDPACLAALQAIEAAPAASAAPVASARGLTVSVDGERVVGEAHAPAGPASGPTATADDVDVKVKFDGLDIARQLAVSTLPEAHRHAPGVPLAFHASWNYGPWIERAEVLVWRARDKREARDVAVPLATLAVGTDGQAVWADPAAPEGETLTYSLRVYDAAGRFDETRPLALDLREAADDLPFEPGAAAPGEGEERLGLANIPLTGGKITVYGSAVPAGHRVMVSGEAVPVDETGAFAATRVVPSGDHAVAIAVLDPSGREAMAFERDVHVPESEWFQVGHADFTAGQRLGDAIEPATAGDYSRSWTRGRIAYYLKGKIKGRYLLTASIDTREGELDGLFRNLTARDPQALLRRLDPDAYYPVYGDDSTTVEDAPTSGKFYVRLEDGPSRLLWGNFNARLHGSELVRFDRTLYGAQVQLRSPAPGPDGGAAASLDAFAAQPGTLPQRDEFRGTGGSAYFLRRQDIAVGSETITVEERDPVTGLVLSRTALRPDEDYEIDTLQGVVLLRRPLGSALGTGSAVRHDAIDGAERYLVVQYEFTPPAGEIEGYAVGGRGEVWLGDHLRLGATGYREDQSLDEATLYGADLVLRASEHAWFELEWAQSEGAGFATVRSTDGGFLFTDPLAASRPVGPASAVRARLVADITGLTGGAVVGRAGVETERREAGFSAPGRSAATGEHLTAAFLDLGDAAHGRLGLRAEQLERDDALRRRQLSAEIGVPVGPASTATLGVLHSDITGNARSRLGEPFRAVGLAEGNGARTDLGLRLETRTAPDARVWLFGQATVARSGTRPRNDRVGLGGERALTDRLTASLEGSVGTSGPGVLGALTYTPTTSDRYWAGYRLSPDTTAGDLEGYDPFASDMGAIVLGTNRRLTDTLSLTSEGNLDMIGRQQSLTHTYGLSFLPDASMRIAAAVEAGTIEDDASGSFDRLAVSGGVTWTGEGAKFGAKGEGRFEEGDGFGLSRDRDTYLGSLHGGIDLSPDWRALARLDAVISRSDQATILDGDYIEGSIGWAYRPVDNDRTSALFKYTYLHDLPGPQQVTTRGDLLGPRQISHVLSVDAIRSLTDRISIGGKYGVRLSQIAWDRRSDAMVRSTAHLGVARLDINVVKEWDVIVEGRALVMPELGETKFGAVVGVYRSLGDNVKVGVGFNFGSFSDDLTDLRHDDKGVFVNVIGKF